MGGFDEFKDDPEMQELMKNPKMAAIAAQIKENPMAAMGALQDPELAPLVMKLVSKINPQIGAMLGGMGGMGGMFGQQWAASLLFFLNYQI